MAGNKKKTGAPTTTTARGMVRKDRTEGERPLEDERAVGRVKRVALGVTKNILGVYGKDDKHFHYRWIRDIGSRIMMALQGGYTHCNKDEVTVDSTSEVDLGDKCSIVSDRKNGEKSFLMKIPLEFYNEDQEAKEAGIRDSEEGLRGQAVGQSANGQTQAYGDIRIGKQYA